MQLVIILFKNIRYSKPVLIYVICILSLTLPSGSGLLNPKIKINRQVVRETASVSHADVCSDGLFP